MKKLSIWHWLFLLFLVAGTAWILISRSGKKFYTNEGQIFGTMYHIKYEYSKDLEAEILARLQEVDASLSMFNEKSLISRINRNEKVKADSLFTTVFNLSEKISKETDGAFDITVAPLVNAWGFGFQKRTEPSSHQIDSLLQIVGYEKVRLVNGEILKDDSRLTLDCSAVAKGFGVDRVAALLDKLGIGNYMVEIGGEIVAKGKNPEGHLWKIGISKPEENNEATIENQIILNAGNIALATSGNYRNFYYQDGKKYAHTIDPKTGYPVQHALLSASVIAPDCATADAYATAFMVMGMERAKVILKHHPELQAYFIYSDMNDKPVTWNTPGFKQYIQ